MNEPGARPEDGVTRYYCDATQGPACALACPAATVYRNYFANEGRGQAGGSGGQIDCLADVGELLQNKKDRLWKMTNGYGMPDAPGGIAKASARIAADAELAARARAALRIGVHWDTEVKGGSHSVCQVFSSALPVSYAKSVRSKDWEPLACCILDATYEATLAAAALLAAERGQRVTLYLTAVGGGAFGNRSQWIVSAMEKALKAFEEAPLDVKLVHFGSLPRSTYASLEQGRKPKTKAGATAAKPVAAASPAQPPPAEGAAEEGATLARMAALLARLDENGDGIVDRSEMGRVLQALLPALTEEQIGLMFEEADADHDGEVHYAEFLAWLFNSESAVAIRGIRDARE
mmetsp:Transcript_151742/g.486847  ORF Transcript_151742/g.486847 Transcript_151742/m.486847 type:complete len:349 (+) Transcript_151742:70-1116(+)